MAETTLTSTPKIAGDDKIAILPGTTTNTMPTTFTNAIYMQDFINKMPQFFPDKDKIEYKVLASTQTRSLLGSRASMDGSITAYYTAELLNAHLKMLEFQNAEAGCFWLVWYINSEDRTVAVRCTVDEKLKTPEDESGDLNTKEIQISNVDEAIEQQGKITGFGTATV